MAKKTELGVETFGDFNVARGISDFLLEDEETRWESVNLSDDKSINGGKSDCCELAT